MKETLEDAAEKYKYNPKGDFCFKNGAKWQQERMYSEEEVLDLIKRAVYQKQNAWKVGELDKWFEQFKKK